MCSIGSIDSPCDGVCIRLTAEFPKGSLTYGVIIFLNQQNDIPYQTLVQFVAVTGRNIRFGVITWPHIVFYVYSKKVLKNFVIPSCKCKRSPYVPIVSLFTQKLFLFKMISTKCPYTVKINYMKIH